MLHHRICVRAQIRPPVCRAFFCTWASRLSATWARWSADDRFQAEADMSRQAKLTNSVEIDPTATLAVFRQALSNLAIEPFWNGILVGYEMYPRGEIREIPRPF